LKQILEAYGEGWYDENSYATIPISNKNTFRRILGMLGAYYEFKG